ncbi:MAG: DUF124 domain-containing protein, partial [uncultured Rubrobacteraceae bacterium]
HPRLRGGRGLGHRAPRGGREARRRGVQRGLAGERKGGRHGPGRPRPAGHEHPDLRRPRLGDSVERGGPHPRQERRLLQHLSGAGLRGDLPDRLRGAGLGADTALRGPDGAPAHPRPV